jgi:hypothetical protein
MMWRLDLQLSFAQASVSRPVELGRTVVSVLEQFSFSVSAKSPNHSSPATG